MTTPPDLPAIRARLQAGCNCGWGGPPGHDASCPCAAAESYARTDVGDLLDECERLQRLHGEATDDLSRFCDDVLHKQEVIDATRAERDAALAEAEKQIARRRIAQEDRNKFELQVQRLTAELARLRAERLAENAVVEAAIAWSEVYDGGSIFKAVERSRAVMDAVDALRAARAGKDGG